MLLSIKISHCDINIILLYYIFLLIFILPENLKAMTVLEQTIDPAKTAKATSMDGSETVTLNTHLLQP